MRFLIVLLLITASCDLSAQQLLFDKTIPDQNVPQASRLRNEMRSHYMDSRYVNQPDFLTPQDFFIAITSNLIVKSRFVRMRSYPSGSFSYEGRLEGPATGQVTFSKFKDRIAGLILLDDGRKYMIDQVAPDIFAISLSNEFSFIPQESHSDFVEVSGENKPNASVMSVCDMNACSGPSTIDIMVVYTQQAENSWGGAASTVANITQAVTNMNASLTSSGINNVTFRLVHTSKVTYTESGSFNTDLTRLAGTSDGYMDNIHSLRDQYGADLVSMIIGSPTSSCGIGYLNTNPTSYSSGSAFNVSLYSCVVGNFTMAHEAGHNMGLRHDWYVDPGTTPCEHHHGYVNQAALDLGASSPASARWRTIMAYNDRCSVAGFNCTRVNLWSNPNLTYNGDVLGVHGGNPEPSDEAWAFYRMACLVASFRSEAGGGGGGGGEVCSAPSGLSASFITTSTTTLMWSAASGAITYDLEYKLSSSSTWITAAGNTSAIAIGLGGLSASSVYDWRVRANCSSGSSAYTQSQFTTQSISLPACDAPSGLSSSGITTSSATISWGFASGANSYDVEYKPSSSGTWFTAASGTSSTSISLGGLASSTYYDWRVRSNCTGANSNYSVSSFSTLSTTLPPPSSDCPGPYDNSSNGSTSGAMEIPLNTDIRGTIAPRNDNDLYRFIISGNSTISISLTSLPANYNLALLNSSGIQIDVSQNNGPQSEFISRGVTGGTYYARVFPKGNANNASTCYSLKVQAVASDLIVKNNFAINLFPNPADNQLNVWVEGIETKAEIKIFDVMGKLILQQVATNTLTQMNIAKLSAGFYMVRVDDGQETRFAKFVKK